MTLLAAKMDRFRATFLSQEEQIISWRIMRNTKNITTAKSHTVTASKAREECWQDSADRVNKVNIGSYINFTTQSL